jgi:hypothetical protein
MLVDILGEALVVPTLLIGPFPTFVTPGARQQYCWKKHCCSFLQVVLRDEQVGSIQLLLVEDLLKETSHERLVLFG